jgi:outer membrane lipoprotein carrier protein
MNLKQLSVILWAVLVLAVCASAGDEKKEPDPAGGKAADIKVEDILAGMEKRYSSPAFSARFHQRSIIKAMDITDTAEGSLLIKRPGKMRWEYETPEKQIIVTDGEVLWVFRPEDKQVMVGDSKSYFGGGKGASFLSDVRLIHEQFTVSLAEKKEAGYHVLKLIPKEKKLDLTVVYLYITQDTFEAARVTTYNSYEDETVIQITDYQFNPTIDEGLFHFKIPEDADIVKLEE